MADKIKVFEKPLSEGARKIAMEELGANCFLSMSSKFHLIDSLKHLKFGTPSAYQNLVDHLITIVKLRIDEGAPFSEDVVNNLFE